MRKGVLISAALAGVALAATPASAQQAAPTAANCAPAGGLSFICGPKRPEDLAVLPGGRWLVASGIEEGGGLHLIDTRTKAWRRWIAPADGKADRRFTDCAAPPDPDRFAAHGLALAPGAKGRARLYVVGHGEREAVEVFDIATDGPEPALAWRGCLRAPDKIEFNGVAAAPDGALLVTVPALPGTSLLDAFEGKATGAIFEWAPGGGGFRKIEGTSLPHDNGIEISPDGKTVYVAAPPARAVTAYRRGATWRKLWSLSTPGMIPDNIHWGPNGKLYAGGFADDEPACGPLEAVNGRVDFGCPRGFRAAVIDPIAKSVAVVAKGAPVAGFQGGATALPAGGDLWISSPFANRLAYRPWP